MRSGNTFVERIARLMSECRIDREGRHGRLIHVVSPARRRKLRGYASARESVTEASWLFVALAYRPAVPHEFLSCLAVDENRRHQARLERTLGNPETARSWASAHAVRLMAIVDEAARAAGGRSDWILEGVDWRQVGDFLAVPADHFVCGMIAVYFDATEIDRPPRREGAREAGQEATRIAAPIDSEGFGGGFVVADPGSGTGVDGPL